MREVVAVHVPEAERSVVGQETVRTQPPAARDGASPPAEGTRIGERVVVQSTPRHGQWLQLVASELSVRRRRGRERRIPDQATRQRAGAEGDARRNVAQATVQRPCTTAPARVKRKKLYPPIAPIKCTRTAY